jgi:competence protein ComEC
VGFELSFVAVLGLVYFSPIIEKKIFELLPKIKQQFCVELIIKLLSATLSAIIITLPLILYHFERFSVVAPVANILVLWIIPWLMLGGFLSLIISMIFFPMGQVLAWVVSLGLKYVIILVNLLGEKTWSSLEIGMPLAGVFVLYGLLYWWYKSNSKKYE